TSHYIGSPDTTDGQAVSRLIYTDEDDVEKVLDIPIQELVALHETLTILDGQVTANTDGEALYRLIYTDEDDVEKVLDIPIQELIAEHQTPTILHGEDTVNTDGEAV